MPSFRQLFSLCSRPAVVHQIGAPPNRLAVGRLDVDMVAAVGSAAGDDPVETDPQVEISWSLDGGYRWSNPVFRAIGREGESRKTTSVNRIGSPGRRES